ncbi:class A beta-lactamase [Actinacidiphila acidipaludis]|uniref:class A beta-lactamase n=1 Tax=Actinacidiphila acidipaludis TaxID=2873382 RepID=UPI0027DF5F97|nr:class A beta-lactamase [Streptomyces acidipaludis]
MLALGLLSGCGGGAASSRAAPAAGKGTATGSASASAGPSDGAAPSADASFQDLEHRFHARLGLFLLDTGTGRTVTYQADRRFATCSTVKALAAAALLRKDDDADLARTIRYSRSDLLDYAPVTSRHVADGMPLSDVIAAALQYSDNTAENLMLRELGGPAGLQRAVREFGDTTTHVDRTEPSLNEAAPGDVRDTSTARALGTDLRALLLGPALPAARRARLTDRMLHNTTGGPYIRAALPQGWKAADKTGSGGHGTRNDIGVVWPASGSPIVVGVLSDRDRQDAPSDDALVADAVRTGLTALRGPAS